MRIYDTQFQFYFKIGDSHSTVVKPGRPYTGTELTQVDNITSIDDVTH